MTRAAPARVSIAAGTGHFAEQGPDPGLVHPPGHDEARVIGW